MLLFRVAAPRRDRGRAVPLADGMALPCGSSRVSPVCAPRGCRPADDGRERGGAAADARTADGQGGVRRHSRLADEAPWMPGPAGSSSLLLLWLWLWFYLVRVAGRPHELQKGLFSTILKVRVNLK